MNWIQTKQPKNLVLPPHSLEYLWSAWSHTRLQSPAWFGSSLPIICAGPHSLQTCILLITSLNLSPYPHFRELCLCLQLLRWYLWSIELLCLYFYWLRLFLFLFSMAQICAIWGKQVFFQCGWFCSHLAKTLTCYKRSSALEENGILLTSLQLGREKLGCYTCILPGWRFSFW